MKKIAEKRPKNYRDIADVVILEKRNLDIIEQVELLVRKYALG